ncbi:excisionase [Acuticoccus sediminis]|uniref:Excisionase n=1 Tax=Acuticoccus sediminis TaxID=2184697 RepID=A0A8B2NXA7_9HYPH|nr:helix-turn-helix transcriptional regulator [Acuticoccus sediminis]RAI00337.1 excisionase [Acuticoccus sediminis]
MERETKAPVYLTTREVADLLRVKERKVYELAAAGEIPHRRVTGKLLFPKDEIDAWISGEPVGTRQAERPAVVVGSHDPLLDWALRESRSGLAALLDGSGDGLERFLRGEAALAAMHVPEDEGWNIETVAAARPTNVVLIAFARRRQGLIHSSAATGPLSGFADLAGRRVVLRQPGSGTRSLHDRLCEEAGVAGSIVAHETVARTETDAAATVYAGDADAALGLEAVARQFRLDFLPLVEERFDLLVDRHAYFTPPVQQLMAFCRTPAFAAKADAMGGYDVSEVGTVRWLSA